MNETWSVQGDYFENCNCQILCPCLLSQSRAMPTEGHCDVPLAFHIDSGRHGETRLDGLNVVVVYFTPGAMAEGNWTLALYLDDRVTPDQRAALAAIFSGEAGGPLARVRRLVTTQLETKTAPIAYERDGRTRRVTIPDILELAVEGIGGRERDEPVWLDNVTHPVNSRLAAARGTGTTYRDHGFVWDNTGRNGHYAGFAWHGP